MKELTLLFLKLGITGFGGPAAHIAMMEEEVVHRRHWITHEHFLDLLGATNLIPGPNSTEMAIHIGLVRAGWKGLVVAGLCFILPAVLITCLFAKMYVLYGSIPAFQPVVIGIRPAIIAVIASAIYRLAKPVIKKSHSLILGLGVVALSLAGVDEVLLLLVCGFLGLFGNRLFPSIVSLVVIYPLSLIPSSQLLPPSDISLTGLGFFFLKIGSILYGSGYVLVAYLQGGLVDARHWLTQAQLFDAIAVGQFTPGPVLSTATFIGYVVLGFPGAAVATLGIFLPSFLLVLISSPFIPRLRRSPIAGGFLDGVNAGSLGLMAAVTIKLALAALTGIGPWVIFVGAAIVLLRWNPNAAWIVVGSGILGWIETHAGL
ncbi:MAG TPA: chromate efflux transporter [Bacteroidota bacterium]|nr:chromate efflux transporter [Bacteroidota bacterium]